MLVEEAIRQIYNHYGAENQRRQCIEELAELTQALCKYDREVDVIKRQDLKTAVQEELADVEIMIRQLKKMFGEKEVNAEIKIKLFRQLDRIAKEKELA